MHLPCRSVEFASDEFQTLLVKDCEKNGEYCAPSHLEFTGDLGTVNLRKWAATTRCPVTYVCLSLLKRLIGVRLKHHGTVLHTVVRRVDRHPTMTIYDKRGSTFWLVQSFSNQNDQDDKRTCQNSSDGCFILHLFSHWRSQEYDATLLRCAEFSISSGAITK